MGETFFSCEQAYQANKFSEGSLSRELVKGIKPFAQENDSAHGFRCWQAGNEASRIDCVQDWDKIKVGIMLDINRAKVNILWFPLLKC